MKTLTEYIKEEIGIAPSIGDMKAASNYCTPGNTIGIGNPKLPSVEEPGSGDVFGLTHKEKKKKAKK